MTQKSKGIKRSAIQLFKALLTHVNSETRMCSVFMKELADELFCDIRTVQRHAKELEDLGLLVRHYRKKRWNYNDKNIFILTGDIDFATQKITRISVQEILDGVKGVLDSHVRQNDTLKEARQNAAETHYSIILIGHSLEERDSDSQKQESVITCQEESVTPKANVEETNVASEKQEFISEKDSQQEVNSLFDDEPQADVDPITLIPHADEIPEVMHEVIRYYFEKTGNNPRWFNGKAVESAKRLAKRHTPERIKAEIDRAVARFVRLGRELKLLYFGYFETVLSGQHRTLKKKVAKPAADGNMNATVTATSNSVDDMSYEDMLKEIANFKEECKE